MRPGSSLSRQDLPNLPNLPTSLDGAAGRPILLLVAGEVSRGMAEEPAHELAQAREQFPWSARGQRRGGAHAGMGEWGGADGVRVMGRGLHRF